MTNIQTKLASKTIFLPKKLQFTYRGAYNFARALSVFDWTLKNRDITINFVRCNQANYQALSLLVLYIWYLKVNNNCRVRLHLGSIQWGATKMWRNIGANQLFHVLTDGKTNFRSYSVKPLFAIRNSIDFREVLKKAEQYTENFDVEYEKTLRYVLSELLYNTLEHGQNVDIPSITQFSWYSQKDEISFIVADLGVGIKKHLGQAYSGLESDVQAIKLALQPQVSGTFLRNQPYMAKNNAGVGLFLSSNIIRKLHADMHIISGNGLVHVSPTDLTARTLPYSWKGTLVYVTIKLGATKDLSLQKMMAEFREAAKSELDKASQTEQKDNYYFNINNYFGKYAEDKGAAIKVRDKYLAQKVREGKLLIIDFEDVISAPHSFLSALLATSIRHLGMTAYKKIKFINTSPEIRETIDFILDENTGN